MIGKLTNLFTEETVEISQEDVVKNNNQKETFDDVVIDESFKIQEKEHSIPANSRSVVKVFTPVTKNDTSRMIDALKRGDLVIINLSKASEEEGRFIYSTLSGSVYSLDGELKMIDSHVMLCAPNKYIVDSDDGQ